MAEKKFDKQKLFAVAVTVLLIFFFVGGFLFGLDRVRSMEGTFPPNDIKEGVSPAPENGDEAVKYLQKVIDKALSEKPKLTFEDKFSISSESVETDGSDTFRATLLFVKDGFNDYISSVEDTEDKISAVNFGEDISALLRVPSLKAVEIEDFICNYIYYQCPSCGETSDEPLDNCEPCGSTREYFKKYRDEYEIELLISSDITKKNRKAFEANFVPRSDRQIDALTKDAFKDILNIADRSCSYKAFRVLFKVKRLTDEISYLSFIKEIDVNANVAFTGKYKDLGVNNISFDLTEYANFSFIWPALELNKEVLEIEPGSTDNLLASLTCEDPLAMTVTWTSSDESIASVDADGYISTGTATGEAVVTATFDYLGKTYSDSCTVVVKTPVESMKMSKKSVRLSQGDEFTLSVEISPKKATIRTVKWYSEDETVASVDENGVVTAHNSGKTIVYALSDDGYYRSTCEVTVE